ncbi:hypothetical protein C8Q76DRAFT_226960 [Earliella scabrosa]|nr:hypothetical protein C8Q76DRAFT_226960 [Earliella scabrosa]
MPSQAQAPVFSARHRALNCYDVLCMIIEAGIPDPSLHEREASECRVALFNAALVCRSWSEPALRALWTRLPSLLPIWHFFTPAGCSVPKCSWECEEYFETVLAAQLYRDQKPWSRLLKYTKHVRELARHPEFSFYCDPEDQELALLGLVLAHNPRKPRPVFPHLRALWWSPASTTDASFLVLAGLTLRHLALDYQVGFDEGLAPLLLRLQESSPLLESLCVKSGPMTMACVVQSLMRTVASFVHLREVDLGSLEVDVASVCDVLSKTNLVSFIARVIVWDRETIALPRTPVFSRLVTLHVGGWSGALAQLFASVRMPWLQRAHLSIELWYEIDCSALACMSAFYAAACSPDLRELTIFLPMPRFRAMVPSVYADNILSALLKPLLAHTQLRDLEVYSEAYKFAASDRDFEDMARAWPALQRLSLEGITWSQDETRSADSHHSHSSSDLEPVRIPTAATLYHFWRHCSHLRELALPYLDLTVDPASLPLPCASEISDHRLVYLRIDRTEWKNGRVQLRWKALSGYANYINLLFPALDLEECAEPSRVLHPPWSHITRVDMDRDVWRGWGRVFLCMREEQQARTRAAATRLEVGGPAPPPILASSAFDLSVVLRAAS